MDVNAARRRGQTEQTNLNWMSEILYVSDSHIPPPLSHSHHPSLLLIKNPRLSPYRHQMHQARSLYNNKPKANAVILEKKKQEIPLSVRSP